MPGQVLGEQRGHHRQPRRDGDVGAPGSSTPRPLHAPCVRCASPAVTGRRRCCRPATADVPRRRAGGATRAAVVLLPLVPVTPTHCGRRWRSSHRSVMLTVTAMPAAAQLGRTRARWRHAGRLDHDVGAVEPASAAAGRVAATARGRPGPAASGDRDQAVTPRRRPARSRAARPSRPCAPDRRPAGRRGPQNLTGDCLRRRGGEAVVARRRRRRRSARVGRAGVRPRPARGRSQERVAAASPGARAAGDRATRHSSGSPTHSNGLSSPSSAEQLEEARRAGSGRRTCRARRRSPAVLARARTARGTGTTNRHLGQSAHQDVRSALLRA